MSTLGNRKAMQISLLAVADGLAALSEFADSGDWGKLAEYLPEAIDLLQRAQKLCEKHKRESSIDLN